MGKKLLLLMLLVAMVTTSLPLQTAHAEVESQYRNPLMRGADPTITRDADGFYYCGFATDNNIYLKRAETVLGISTAKSRLVWKKPENFGYVWGPYIYRLAGKWYIYFASGPETDFGYGHPSTYVLENESPDPFEGNWVLKGSWSNKDENGQATEKAGLMNAEGYGLPCGVITMGGETYYTYTKYFYYEDKYLGTVSGSAIDYTRTKFDECPTIVKMLNPWTLDNGTVADSTGELSKGTECTLARPTYDWEKYGDNINEGAAVVEKDGKVYFAYSASSFMNDNYGVAVSYADLNSDLLNPDSWQKLPVPLMQKSPENSAYGPGSPLFVKSEDGTEDWLIHHAGPVGGQTGSNRWVRATPVSWTDNDFVNVGVPSNPGTVFDRPSGEEKSEVLEAEDATCVGVEKRIISDSARSSGSGNVKFNEAGGYVEFDVEAESAGMYSLDFRYNNVGSATNMQLTVNDSPERTLSFESNGDNTVDLDIFKTYNITLQKGNNKIRLTAPVSSELILDTLTIKKTTLYEAEDATLSGGTKVSTEHAGYNGTGYVDNLYTKGTSVAFKVTAPNTGNYSVDLRYCNGFYGEKINKSLSIYVNGVRVKTADCFYGTSWSDWQDRYDNLNLKQGVNTIEYKHDDTSLGNVNIDYITVTEAVTNTYEAEQANLTGGASLATDHTGFTGTGFVGGLWQDGAVEFNVDVETAATYDVSMKYALGFAGETRNMNLYINGESKGPVTFTGTDSWAKWSEKVVAMDLKEGINTIKLTREGAGQGDINLDNIHLQRRIPWSYQAENATIIEKKAVAVPSTYEAEQATLTGSAIVATDHTGYTGTGFVGGLWQDGAVEFNVDAETAGTYDVALKYALGFNGETRSMNLYINGAFKEKITFTDTGSWDSWGKKVVAMDLSEGNNTIKLAREGVGQGDINLDNIHLQVTTYEAEKAKLSGGASVAIDHTGYTGTGFVAGLWQDGAIEFSVDVLKTDTYDVAMKYALGFIGETRNMNLYVNGVFKEALTFADTGSWNSWGEKVAAMDLNEGNNIIKLVREGAGQGDINLDNIHLQRRELNEGNNTIVLGTEGGQGVISLDNIDPQVTTYEAYEAYQANNASIKVGKHDDQLWYEGTGYVGDFENVSEGIEFTVNVPYTGTHTATVRYSGVQENNMTMSLYVNGNKINQIAFPPTKDLDEWAETTFDVHLNAGDNTIKIVRDADDSGFLNIDSLTIDKYSSAKTSLKDPGLVSGTVYVMKSKTSGKAADVAGYSRDPGALVNEWSYLGNINQMWELLDQGNGYWKLMSSYSGHMLDVADTTNYFTCQQTNDPNSLTQQWKIEKVGDFYRLSNRQYDMVLEVVDGLTNNGTMIRLAAYEEGAARQLWNIANGFDATGINPVVVTPGGETPGGSTPGGSTPGGSTPGGSTPGGSTPGGSTPGGSTPGGSTPGGSTPGGSTPSESTQSENTSGSIENIVLEDADLKDGSYTLPTDSIVKKITESKDSVVNVAVKRPNSKADTSIILEAEVLTDAAKAGKTLSVTVKDESDLVVYTWSFDKDQLKQSQNKMKDVNLTLDISALNENAALKNVTDGSGIVMNFAYSGVLPAQASVKAYVGNMEGVKAGNKIYFYHVNENTGKLEELPYSSKYTVDAKGYITVDILHCSDYVALTKEAPKDMYVSLTNQIKVTPLQVNLTLGKKKSTSVKIELPLTLQLVNDLKDKTSQSALGAVTVSYSSSNKKVATVDKRGKITAVCAGKTVITTTLKLYNGKVKKVKTDITVKGNSATVTK